MKWTKLFHRQRAQFFGDPKSGRTVIVAVEHHTGKLHNGRVVDEQRYKYATNSTIPPNTYKNITASRHPQNSNTLQRQSQPIHLTAHLPSSVFSYSNHELMGSNYQNNYRNYVTNHSPPMINSNSYFNAEAQNKLHNHLAHHKNEQPGYPASKYPAQSLPLYIPENRHIQNSLSAQQPSRQWPHSHQQPSNSERHPPRSTLKHNAGPHTQLSAHHHARNPGLVQRSQPVLRKHQIQYSATSKPPVIAGTSYKPYMPHKPSSGNQNLQLNYQTRNMQHSSAKIPLRQYSNVSQPFTQSSTFRPITPNPQIQFTTSTPLYPSYPPAHLFIPQEPYDPSSLPSMPHRPIESPNSIQFPQSQTPFKSKNSQQSFATSQQKLPYQKPYSSKKIDSASPKKRPSNEKEKKEREWRKKLKKDALFSKLKQQERERWLQLRMNYLRSGKIPPSHLLARPTKPAHSESFRTPNLHDGTYF